MENQAGVMRPAFLHITGCGVLWDTPLVPIEEKVVAEIAITNGYSYERVVASHHGGSG